MALEEKYPISCTVIIKKTNYAASSPTTFQLNTIHYFLKLRLTSSNANICSVTSLSECNGTEPKLHQCIHNSLPQVPILSVFLYLRWQRNQLKQRLITTWRFFFNSEQRTFMAIYAHSLLLKYTKVPYSNPSDRTHLFSIYLPFYSRWCTKTSNDCSFSRLINFKLTLLREKHGADFSKQTYLKKRNFENVKYAFICNKISKNIRIGNAIQ